MGCVMNYVLVVSKDLAIPLQDFVARWNADPTCRAVARASVDYSTKSVYAPCAVPLPALELFEEDAAIYPFYELIQTVLCKQPVCKQAVCKPAACKSTEITQFEKPNGARVLLVKAAEADCCRSHISV